MRLQAFNTRSTAQTVVDPESPSKQGMTLFRTLEEYRPITPVKETVDEQGEMFLTSTISIQKKVRHTKPQVES